jgi:hypothetical protein
MNSNRLEHSCQQNRVARFILGVGKGPSPASGEEVTGCRIRTSSATQELTTPAPPAVSLLVSPKWAVLIISISVTPLPADLWPDKFPVTFRLSFDGRINADHAAGNPKATWGLPGAITKVQR